MKTGKTRKYVYLFELDSVRNTDREIKCGLNALYNEITWNGNVVVLTFNQLVDSRAFFSLLADDRHYDNIVSLFEKGALRVSQYGDIRTISQYLLNSLESEKPFVYSGWPLKSTQRRLIALIKRSLVYSDLSEIDHLINDCNDNERKDIFIEVREKPKEGITEGWRDGDDGFSEVRDTELDNCSEILKQLHGLIKTVLRLSEMNYIYIAPKDTELCAGRGLLDFLALISGLNLIEKDFAEAAQRIGERIGELPCIDKDARRRLKQLDPVEAFTLFKKAIEIIKSTESRLKRNSNNRSDYVNELLKIFKEESKKDDSELIKQYQLAEAIVNLACNYAYEASIRNVSKHYNDNDLTKTAGTSSPFVFDFIDRLLCDFWLSGEREDRFLREEVTTFKKFDDRNLYRTFCRNILEYCRNISGVTFFSSSVHFIKYAGNWERTDSESYEPRYEADLARGISGTFKHKMVMLGNLFLNLGMVCVSFMFAVLMELGFQWIQRKLNQVSCSGLVHFLVVIFVTQLLTQCLAFCFNKLLAPIKIKFLSLAEASEQVGRIIFIDWVCIVMRVIFKPKVYINMCKVGKKAVGEVKSEKPLSHWFIQSNSLKKYMRMIGEKKHADLFRLSDVYPLSIHCSNKRDVENFNTTRMLCRLEEMYGYRFGVVYESRFNSIIVDPVKKAGGGYFPYERVIPKAGNGVVALTVCKGKFVLLRQYRHAPRTEILSFPRGFAEENLMDKDNVAKELNEELLVQPSDIVSTEMLGKVFPDSGILATCASVWLVTISRYEAEKGHEGILDAVELDEDQFCNYIRDGKITDGFTLAAYVLYKTHRSNR